MADDLLKRDEIEELFRVQASLRDKRNLWLYGERISSLLAQSSTVECKEGIQISPKGKAPLLRVRNGPQDN